MIVDVQHHYAPPSLRAAATDHGADFLKQMYEVDNHPAYELEMRLEAMDAAGIDVAVLSIARPHPGLAGERGASAELYRAVNNELIEVSDAHPDRFAALLTLPFPFPSECIAELERVGSHPGVDGVIMHCEISRWTPDQPELEPVFAQIASMGLPLMLHPHAHVIGPSWAFADWNLWSSIPPMLTTSVAAARMMLSGLLDRIPELTAIVPHLGGVLPYLAQRLVNQSGTGAAEHDVLWYLRNRVLTDSVNLYQPALAAAAATFPCDRILLASDYPAAVSRNLDDLTHVLRRSVDYIAESALDESDRNGILHDNAVRYGFASRAAAMRLAAT